MPTYFITEGTDPKSSAVYVLENDTWRSISPQGEISLSHDGALPKFISRLVVEIDPAEASRLIEARVAAVRQEKAESDRLAGEAAASFRRSGAIIFGAIVVLLLTGVGLVVGYCSIGPIHVQEEDLLSATVTVRHTARIIDVDLTDPAMREEMARLLNGLHRWCGMEYEMGAWGDLEVKLQDGLKYYVFLYPNDALVLGIGRGEPNRELPRMWVRSVDMKRFLAEYSGP